MIDELNYLSNQTVKVDVCRSLDLHIAATYVVDGFVVDHEGTVGILQGCVSSKDGVVGLHDGSRDLWSWVDRKLQLGFLCVVDRETFHEKRGKARAGSTTERVEDKKALKTGALVRELADPVEGLCDKLLADGVVTASVVVGSILLASDQLLGVEQLAVSSSANFTCREVSVDRSKVIGAQNNSSE